MTSIPRLDTRTLQFLKETSTVGRPDILVQVIDRFEQNSASLLVQMNASIAQADFASVKRSAHSLKGSAAMIGAKLAADLARKMEVAANSEQLDDCCRIYEDLNYENDKVLQVLKAEWYM